MDLDNKRDVVPFSSDLTNPLPICQRDPFACRICRQIPWNNLEERHIEVNNISETIKPIFAAYL